MSHRLSRAWKACGGGAFTLALLALAACKNHGFPEYPANYREFAYVSNGASDTVSVFDVVNVRVDREIQVGANPTGIAANPKRNEIYVVNTGRGTGNGSVSIIDAEKNAVAGNIQVGKQPYFIDVEPDGNLAYVANSGSGSVSVLDLKTRRQIAEVATGAGAGVVRVSADGKTLVVTNRTANSVSIVDARQGRVRKLIEGCPGATDAVILSDSRKAFVACSSGHQVMAIALAKAAEGEGAAHTDARADALEAMLDVGHSPVHISLKPDGGEIFVSNFDSDSVSEIVTGTNDVQGAFMMGSHPVYGLISADNSLLYVSNFRSQELTMYSIDDGKRARIDPAGSGSIRVGDGPDSLAFSADGHLLFAVDARSSDLAVIRTSTHSLFTFLPTGRQPNAIAVKAFQVH